MSNGIAPLVCHQCGVELEPGRAQFYVVRIMAVADPSPPNLTEEDLRGDLRGEIRKLIEGMSELSEQEALDQVYRRMILFLCNACYQEWIENPLGA